jgi:hypothetical protein
MVVFVMMPQRMHRQQQLNGDQQGRHDPHDCSLASRATRWTPAARWRPAGQRPRNQNNRRAGSRGHTQSWAVPGLRAAGRGR